MKNLLKVQIASRRQVKYYLVYTLLFSSHDAGFSTTPELMHWKFLRIMVSPSKKWAISSLNQTLCCSSKLSLNLFCSVRPDHQLLQFSLSATADKKARPTFLMIIMRESSLYHELFLKRGTNTRVCWCITVVWIFEYVPIESGKITTKKNGGKIQVFF